MFSERINPAVQNNPISLRKAELLQDNRSLLDLSNSNPTSCGLIPPGVLDSLSNDQILRYEPDCRGLLSTRQALAAFLGCTADRLFLTASTSEAYSWLFKLLCDPGEAVLVPRPGYPLFDYLAALENVETRAYRLEYQHPAGWFVDLDQLAAQLADPAVKGLILINPNNPTGSYIRATEREAIIELCCRHGVALISDEVFLSYSLEHDTDAASFGSEERGLCFCLNGLSKLLCLPQLKLGWIQLGGAAELVRQAADRLDIIADSFLSVGAPVLHALPALLKEVPGFNAGVRQRLMDNLACAKSVFETEASPFRLLHCDAGWTALLEVPRYETEESLVLSLMSECSVIVHPGYFFDCEREGILALSMIVEPATFAEGCKRIKAWFDKHQHGVST